MPLGRATANTSSTDTSRIRSDVTGVVARGSAVAVERADGLHPRAVADDVAQRVVEDLAVTGVLVHRRPHTRLRRQVVAPGAGPVPDGVEAEVAGRPGGLALVDVDDALGHDVFLRDG